MYILRNITETKLSKPMRDLRFSQQ